MFQTHVVIGYLLGVLGRVPTGAAVAGSALPDLVDRALCWFGPTENEHTVFHSLFLAVPASILSVRLFGRRGAAFALAWLVHIAGDLLNVTSADGPRFAPSYVLYPFRTEEVGDRFPRVSLSPPLVDFTYRLSPVMLAFELALTVWGLLLLGREVEPPGWLLARLP